MNMLSSDQGYRIAHSIDKIFNSTLEKYPISNKENYGGYVALIRTVRTILNITDSENDKHLARCPACGKPR